MIAKPGDLVFFNGNCWHGASPNKSDHQRAALLIEFLPKYIKPVEDLISYLDEKFYDTIVQDDCDGYILDDQGQEIYLFSFRKNVVPEHLCKQACDSFRKAAKVKKENRGAPAGPVSKDRLPAYVKEIISPKHQCNKAVFRTQFRKKDGTISPRLISNYSMSNIAGFYDYPANHQSLKNKGADQKRVCRPTSFVQKENQKDKTHNKWLQAKEFVKHVDHAYRQAAPNAYRRQKKLAAKKKQFQIFDTAFSTITLNYSLRTGVHQDRKNITKEQGVAVLVVCDDYLNPNSYEGCCLGFPQFKFAIDICASGSPWWPAANARIKNLGYLNHHNIHQTLL